MLKVLQKKNISLFLHKILVRGMAQQEEGDVQVAEVVSQLGSHIVMTKGP